MSIHWDSLLAVFVVSLGSAVAVVVLVALAMLGLSARAVVRRRASDVGVAAALPRGRDGRGRRLPGGGRRDRAVRALGRCSRSRSFTRSRGGTEDGGDVRTRARPGRRGSRRGGAGAAARRGRRRRHRGRVAGRGGGPRRHDHLPRDQRRPRRRHHRSPGVPPDGAAAARGRAGRPDRLDGPGRHRGADDARDGRRRAGARDRDVGRLGGRDAAGRRVRGVPRRRGPAARRRRSAALPRDPDLRRRQHRRVVRPRPVRRSGAGASRRWWCPTATHPPPRQLRTRDTTTAPRPSTSPPRRGRRGGRSGSASASVRWSPRGRSCWGAGSGGASPRSRRPQVRGPVVPDPVSPPGSAP